MSIATNKQKPKHLDSQFNSHSPVLGEAENDSVKQVSPQVGAHGSALYLNCFWLAWEQSPSIMRTSSS